MICYIRKKHGTEPLAWLEWHPDDDFDSYSVTLHEMFRRGEAVVVQRIYEIKFTNDTLAIQFKLMFSEILLKGNIEPISLEQYYGLNLLAIL